jgi:SAM-dependent methyltransferase
VLARVRRKLRPRRRLIDASAKSRAKIRNPRLITRVAEREGMLTGGQNLRNYFEVGESALSQIKAGLAAAGVAAPERILDLPCGYGRVLRHLRAEWPDAEITAMDIDAEAAEFCATTFSAKPVVSRQPVWEVSADDGHDLLWCGSLLTHFDKADWVPTLSYFRDRLAPGGVVVFTTHGDLSIDILAGEPAAANSQMGRMVRDYGMGGKATEMADAARRTGFAFSHYSDSDLTYGLSVSAPEWVRSTVANISGLTFVSFSPEGWFGHQDVWTYQVS